MLDADPDASPPWLVTAYVPGPSLHQAVAEHGAMPTESALLLMAGVAEALAGIHAAGVVHRDLKPSNVLLAPDGPRVIDFGIARAADSPALTRRGFRVGSPQFMAPEQILGQPATPAIDLFALGHLAAYAALGHSPYGAGTVDAVQQRILRREADLTGCQAPLRELIERCISSEPGDRPTPAEVIAACMEHKATATVPVAGPWLPVAMARALALHAVPTAPPVEPSGSPATIAPQTAELTETPSVPRRRLSRTALLSGIAVAAVIVAVLVPGIDALRGPGTSGTPQRTTAAGPRSSISAHAAGKAAPLTATITPSANPMLDPCLIGYWKGVTEELPNHIADQPVMFTGAGASGYFRPDGTSNSVYGSGVTYSATYQGTRWTEVFAGTATYRYETRNGLLLISDIVANGTVTWYQNGSFNSSGPLSVIGGASPYTCSATTLRIYFTDGGSVELTRISHS